jgi:hypothetical protein
VGVQCNLITVLWDMTPVLVVAREVSRSRPNFAVSIFRSLGRYSSLENSSQEFSSVFF